MTCLNIHVILMDYFQRNFSFVDHNLLNSVFHINRSNKSNSHHNCSNFGDCIPVVSSTFHTWKLWMIELVSKSSFIQIVSLSFVSFFKNYLDVSLWISLCKNMNTSGFFLWGWIYSIHSPKSWWNRNKTMNFMHEYDLMKIDNSILIIQIK